MVASSKDGSGDAIFGRSTSGVKRGRLHQGPTPSELLIDALSGRFVQDADAFERMSSPTRFIAALSRAW